MIYFPFINFTGGDDNDRRFKKILWGFEKQFQQIISSWQFQLHFSESF